MGLCLFIGTLYFAKKEGEKGTGGNKGKSDKARATA